MKFKKIYLSGLAVAMMSAGFTSCSDFTEVDPKGLNLLETVDQLEMLLNEEYYISTSDHHSISGEMIYEFDPIVTTLNEPSVSRGQILIGWNEANHDSRMADLTASDSFYEDAYGWIGRIANPIISRADEATGDEAKKKQIKCEAYVLRAYMHYLLAMKFAKAYDPATAETELCIPCMDETVDISVPQPQSTMKQVFDGILSDLDKAIEIDGLPNVAVNKMRFNKACLYAVKAHVLMTVQRFDEAEQAAKSALAVSDVVTDYQTLLVDNYAMDMFTGEIIPIQVILRPKVKCEEDYFCNYNELFFNVFMPAFYDGIEDGSVVKDNISTDALMYNGYMMDYPMIGQPAAYDMESYWPNLGLKSTQMYLILAECAILNNNIDEATRNLDIIRVNRIAPDVYTPINGVVTDKAEAIDYLKKTMVGEDFYSVFAFNNRKRWTKLPDFKETYHRTLAGFDEVLTPESSLWVFPFPKNVTSVNTSIKQNY